MRARNRVFVEIDVQIQILAETIFVRAAAEVVRIINQIRNAGHSAQPNREISCSESLHPMSRMARQAWNVFMNRLVTPLAVFVQGCDFIEWSKFSQQFLAKGLVEEIINNDMTKRLGVCVAISQFVRARSRRFT